MSCFVVQLDLQLSEKLRELLLAQGFEITQPAYTLFQGKKKGLSCTLYTSGKLTIQGKEMKEFIEYYLEPEILGKFTFGYEHLAVDETERIGIDESGKGDFFGPLCIAGVHAKEGSVTHLAQMGVKDSKLLNDTSIVKIAEKIKKDYQYHIVKINPEKYNELYEKFGNLNLLLGWGHATCIENLIDKTGCKKVIIDQFAHEHVVETALKRKKKEALLVQRHRGEQDLVVAAASILARAAFVEGLGFLEKKVNLPLPKGASKATIEAGKRLVSKNGAEILKFVGKLHFKTASHILEGHL